MTDTNKYTVSFFAMCPTTPVRIEYTLTIIKQPNDPVLMVENLVNAVMLLQHGTHEEFADQLHQEFGGMQVLTAEHHGVRIETVRGVL